MRKLFSLSLIFSILIACGGVQTPSSSSSSGSSSSSNILSSSLSSSSASSSSSSSTEACQEENKYSDAQCKNWDHYCPEGSQYYTFMMNNCRKECLCDSDGTVSSSSNASSSSESSNDDNINYPTLRPTNEEAAACVGEGENSPRTMEFLKAQWDTVPGKGVYKEYDGNVTGVAVYTKAPRFEQGDMFTGELSEEYLAHSLAFYNYMRCVAGLGKQFISSFKQERAQAGSWSYGIGLLGSHYPKWEDAQALGVPRDLYDKVYASRSAANLMGWPDPDLQLDSESAYTNLKTTNHNISLTKIWNEGEGDNIKGLGHRRVYLYREKDLGIGYMPYYNYAWMQFGTDRNTEGYAEYYLTPNLEFVMWPAHGYFPWRLLADRHQSWSIRFNGFNRLSEGDAVTITMEYFVGSRAEIEAGYTNARESLTISHPYVKNYESVRKDRYVPYITSGRKPVSGGYFLEIRDGNYLTFRHPYEWFSFHRADMKNSATNNLHEFRFTIEGLTRKGASTTESEVFYTRFFDLDEVD